MGLQDRIWPPLRVEVRFVPLPLLSQLEMADG